MQSPFPRVRPCPAARIAGLLAPLALASSCTTIGSMMSPYSETFSCKNEDHGQCIHPDQAYADAVAGRPSHSDPHVTKDRKLLRHHEAGKTASTARSENAARRLSGNQQGLAFTGYRDSVYRELQGLIDAPVTPMLKAPRTVRTLILPYADRQRPDRLYMPRYVYSILEAPSWVVGDYLVPPVSPADKTPVLRQVQDEPAEAPSPDAKAEPRP